MMRWYHKSSDCYWTCPSSKATKCTYSLPHPSYSLPAAPPPNAMDEFWELEPYEDDVESPLAFLEADIVDAAGKPFMAHSLTDTLINAEVLLPREDSQAIAKVVR